LERVVLRGCIFDVEGSLVDSVEQNLTSLDEALRDFGFQVPKETLQLYSGLDGDQTLPIILPDVDATGRQAILEAQSKIFEGKYLDGVRPFTGVRDLFASLSSQNGRIALATHCKGATLKHYLSILKVDDLIAVPCGDDVKHGKPDPPLVGISLRKLGLPASQTVMIGDTPYDAEAGPAAGTSAGGVLTGVFSREALTDAHCIVVAEDLLALLLNFQSLRPTDRTNATGLKSQVLKVTTR
jgi:phosphoglycolate phosphatase-like HAD superfamily hydrolase